MLSINKVLLLLLVIISSMAGKVYAQQTVLILTPNQCISVHQGEQCYVDININWQTPNIGDYCLFSNIEQAPIHCWQGVQSGHIEQELVANENVTFSLRTKNNPTSLADKTLKMTWVYKKSVRARMSWRLF